MLFNESELKEYIEKLITTEVAKKVQPQKEWRKFCLLKNRNVSVFVSALKRKRSCEIFVTP